MKVLIRNLNNPNNALNAYKALLPRITVSLKGETVNFRSEDGFTEEEIKIIGEPSYLNPVIYINDRMYHQACRGNISARHGICGEKTVVKHLTDSPSSNLHIRGYQPRYNVQILILFNKLSKININKLHKSVI